MWIWLVEEGELVLTQSRVNIHKAMKSTPLKLIYCDTSRREFAAIDIDVEVFQLMVYSMAPLLLGDGFTRGKMSQSIVFINSSPGLVCQFLLIEDALSTVFSKAEVSRFVRFCIFVSLEFECVFLEEWCEGTSGEPIKH